MTIEELLQKNINILTMSSPYAFDMLIRTFTRKNPNIDTCAVYTENGNYYLDYNPEFLLKFKTPARSFILCHECLHLLLHHCSGYRGSSDPKEQLIDNIAMDLAVNCLIPVSSANDRILLDYPKEIKEDGTAGKVLALLPCYYSFDDYLSFEQYKELLMQRYRVMSIEGILADMEGHGGRIDNHGGFKEDSIADSNLKNMFERSERNRLFGNMSVNAIEALRAAQSRQVPWHRLLRIEAGHLVTWENIPTRRRYHKYHHKPFPGYEKKTVAPIACYLDVSGSMSTEQKEKCLGELLRLADLCPVYLWTFDAQVEFPDRFRVLNKQDFMRPVKLDGTGGTAFTPIFEHALSKGFRSIVVLTDGWAEEVTMPLPRDFKALWVINNGSDGGAVQQPGKMLYIK